MTETGVSKGLHAHTTTWWDRIEETLLAFVEHLNPILVKEARQALKSRQFIATFFLTLLACWIASLSVILVFKAEVFYVAAGDQVLGWYCGILAFSLFLVVPYSAYRSITTEQEDNTYELLSITSLSSGQIITGKLGSAIVQMLVYLCAVSPCIAFTFLLRGVDLQLVAFIIVAYFLVSVGASMVALMVGTAAKARYTQALTSVLVVLCLLGLFTGGITLTLNIIESSDQYFRDTDFWIGIAAILTVFFTTFLLVHAAASAQIAFSSENRSSRLRWMMLLQFVCFLGWIGGIVAAVWENIRPSIFEEIAMFAISFAGVYWYAMGTLMTSEWPHLSRRVQRSLPQSRAGQMLLTWFNPGPGTGFMFAVANMTALTVFLFGLLLYVEATTFATGMSQAMCAVGFAWCYVVIFLGVGALLISVLRSRFFISMTAGFLLHVILLVSACAIPQFITLSSNSYGRGNSYSLLHASNPFWTMAEAVERRSFASIPEAFILAIVLPSTALVVLLVCFRFVAAEVQLRRRNLPTRVAEEEADLHPALAMGPTSPWDVEEVN